MNLSKNGLIGTSLIEQHRQVSHLAQRAAGKKKCRNTLVREDRKHQNKHKITASFYIYIYINLLFHVSRKEEQENFLYL